MDTSDANQTTGLLGSGSADSPSSKPSSVSSQSDDLRSGVAVTPERNKAVRLVKVLPDVLALDRELVYALPASLGRDVSVGTIVRVPLNGRRVRGWVTSTKVAPESVAATTKIADVLSVSSLGPLPDVVDVARWAQVRFVGPLAAFLDSASPSTNVPVLKSSKPMALVSTAVHAEVRDQLIEVPPAADRMRYVRELGVAGRTVLVLVPTHAEAYRLVGALRRTGARAFPWADNYGAGFASAESTQPRYIVGTRAAAWASVVDLAAIVVLDAHDHLYGEERAPTWNAIEIARYRADAAGVPMRLLTPIPHAALREQSGVEPVWASAELRSQGWAPTIVVDRKVEDPTKGLFPHSVVKFLDSDQQSLVIYNRTGRIRLLQCQSCWSVASCERCGGSVHQHVGDGGLSNDGLSVFQCSRCGFERPEVCLSCAGQKFKSMRVGATKVAQDLSTLLRQEVGLVDSQKDDLPQHRVVVGTEALLRRSDPVGRVAFIDFDQELYGSRISSDVRACALLALAHRLVGGSRRDGMVLVQTSMPQHPVVEASVAKDISTLTAVMSQHREVLNLPPFSAIARIEGAASPAYVDVLKQQLEHVDAGSILRSVDVASTGPDQWLVRAPTEAALSQALRLVARSDLTTAPGARLRIAVNPVDL